MATQKATKKRASQLRKQAAHVRASKVRSQRKEVQQVPGVTSQEQAACIADANLRIEQPLAVNVNVDVDKLVEDVVERLRAESAVAKPVADHEPVVNADAPAPSPVEAAMLDLINTSEETERLVHELGIRLAPVLKESNGDVVVLGRVGDNSSSVPLVDALRQRAGHMTAINGQLLDLLHRLAT